MTHQLQTKLWREGGLLSDAVDCHIYIYTVLIRAGGSFFGTPQLVQSLCPSLSLTKLKTATEFNRVQPSSTVK